MNKYFLFFMFAFVIILYFFWGIKQTNRAERATCEKEIILKEKEVIKYVTKKKDEIHAEPNAGRDDLLRLMHENKL